MRQYVILDRRDREVRGGDARAKADGPGFSGPFGPTRESDPMVYFQRENHDAPWGEAWSGAPLQFAESEAG
jgi:hypothetical protein